MVADGPPLPRKSRLRAWMVGLLLPVMIVVGLFYGVEAWVNAQWRAAVADYEKEGETLNYLDLLPPPLPEAENFAAIEALRDLPVVVDGDEGKGAPAAKRAALLKMKEDIPPEAMRHLGSRVLNAKPDWAEMAKVFREKGKLLEADPPAGMEAASVRKALEKSHPLLVDLARRAMRFSQSQWVPPMRERYAGEPLILMKTPHYNKAVDLANALRVHAAACVAMGDASTALADACAILLLSRSFEDEGTLITCLIGMTLDTIALDLLWFVFQETPGKLSEAELAHGQYLLEGTDYKKRLLQGARSEVIVGTGSIDYLIENPAKWNSQTPVPSEKWVPYFPKMFLTLNKVRLLDSEREHMIIPFKKSGFPQVLDHEKQLDDYFKADGMGPWMFDRRLARIIMPVYYLVCRKAAVTETLRGQAVIACALERYRLKYGRYPSDLEALVPAFLTQVPLDPMDDRPLRYRLEPEGHFQLWGVGLDRVDDGGQIKIPRDVSLTPSVLQRDGYLGDWPWHFPAKNGEKAQK